MIFIINCNILQDIWSSFFEELIQYCMTRLHVWYHCHCCSYANVVHNVQRNTHWHTIERSALRKLFFEDCMMLILLGMSDGGRGCSCLDGCYSRNTGMCRFTGWQPDSPCTSDGVRRTSTSSHSFLSPVQFCKLTSFCHLPVQFQCTLVINWANELMCSNCKICILLFC